MKKEGKRVTIKDIARAVGVTHPTVSRALNNDHCISVAMRKKIAGIAAEMGYRPNLIARSLVRNRTRIIACIIPTLNPHLQPILKGVAESSDRHQYGLMIFTTQYWSDVAQSYLSILDNWRVDGVLMYNIVKNDDPNRDLTVMHERGVPAVFINKYLREKKADAVGVDNYDAVSQAVTHLVQQGHKRIGVMNGGMTSIDGIDRFEAFKVALTAHGLRYRKSLAGFANFTYEQAVAEMTRILDSRYSPPTAMFCASDLMAFGVIHAIEQKGLSVPDDIAVVGFDNMESAALCKPGLTTLYPPLEDVGEQAVQLLLKKIEHPHSRPEQIKLKARLIVRESSTSRKI